MAKIKLKEILNDKSIEGEPLKEPFTIYYHFVDRKDDPVLQQNIKDEIERAIQTYIEKYPIKPKNNFLE